MQQGQKFISSPHNHPFIHTLSTAHSSVGPDLGARAQHLPDRGSAWPTRTAHYQRI